jgi:hypothetical protein
LTEGQRVVDPGLMDKLGLDQTAGPSSSSIRSGSPKRRGKSRHVALVALGCALAGTLLAEPSEANQQQVEIALKALGHSYKTEGVDLTVQMPVAGRTHLVRVTTPIKALHYTDNPKSGKIELRKIWCGIGLPAPASPELLKQLLQMNVNVKVGAWQLVKEGNLVFEANIGAGSSPQMMETVLLATAETCDGLERELESKKVLTTVDKF